jgi:hypothetical protein
VLAFGVIALGVVAALCIALFPVHSSNDRHGTAGCGDAAAAVFINGEGANVRLGRRVTKSACYRTAEKRLLIAGVVLVAPFAVVLIATYSSRRKAG